MSLRLRLTALTALTLAAGLAVLCLVGNLLLSRTIDSDVRGRLDARLSAVASSLSVRSGSIHINETITDSALDSYTWVYDARGDVLDAPHGRPTPSRLADELARRSAAGGTARADVTQTAPGGVLLGAGPILSRGRRVGTVVADISVVTYESLRRRVLLGSIALALLTLLVAVLATRRALRAALAPVEQMTRDAADWGAHDLERRFGLGPGRDEITKLAATLDQLLGRIAASRRHEQRFAAEVAHELRTPLAAVRGIAELARDTDDLGEARAAIAQIENQSKRISATLDTLIAFARRESTPAADGVDLAAVAAEFTGVPVTGASAPRVEGDPALIRQMLAPLIENARRHATSRAWVEISASAGTVSAAVRDDGPGVASELGTRVFEPGVRGTDAHDGAGLGLPLALRLAHSCGGDVSLGEGPGGNFILNLPALGRAETSAGVRSS